MFLRILSVPLQGWDLRLFMPTLKSLRILNPSLLRESLKASRINPISGSPNFFAILAALEAEGILRTIYDLIDPNKEFNPELTTVSALIRALAA